jgi:hypothetical protein
MPDWLRWLGSVVGWAACRSTRTPSHAGRDDHMELRAPRPRCTPPVDRWLAHRPYYVLVGFWFARRRSIEVGLASALSPRALASSSSTWRPCFTRPPRRHGRCRWRGWHSASSSRSRSRSWAGSGRLEVSTKSAYQWRRVWVAGGAQALASKGVSGPDPKLSDEQLARAARELYRRRCNPLSPRDGPPRIPGAGPAKSGPGAASDGQNDTGRHCRILSHHQDRSP